MSMCRLWPNEGCAAGGFGCCGGRPPAPATAPGVCLHPGLVTAVTSRCRSTTSSLTQRCYGRRTAGARAAIAFLHLAQLAKAHHCKSATARLPGNPRQGPPTSFTTNDQEFAWKPPSSWSPPFTKTLLPLHLPTFPSSLSPPGLRPRHLLPSPPTPPTYHHGRAAEGHP